MLKTATAFDYGGTDRAHLFRLGAWIADVLQRRSARELQELATSFTGNKYEDLMGLVRLLRAPGVRLVVFEDKALSLGFLVMRLLQDEKESFSGGIGKLASPLLADVEEFIEQARRSPGS